MVSGLGSLQFSIGLQCTWIFCSSNCCSFFNSCCCDC